MLWVFICTVHLTVCSCHVTYAVQSESTFYCCLNVKKHLARSRREIWIWSDCNWTRTKNHLVFKETLNHLPLQIKGFSCVLSTYLYDAFDCMFLSYQIHGSSESTLYCCLNVKKYLARSRREIWISSDWNWTRTKNHLVLKQTLNHLPKLTKGLSCVLSTYLYGAFDCMFFSYHVRA